MASPTPYVARLFLYPCKSLDREECDRVTILPSGALAGDRSWAIVDRHGRFVNGKREPKIHLLRSSFDFASQTLRLKISNSDQTQEFKLQQSPSALCDWLTEYFGYPVTLKQNLAGGFPDDLASPGATIISTATLEEIASWYQDLDPEAIRLRFRANIELGGVPAFWEDRLFTNTGDVVEFQIGEVAFRGINPCQRCIVVTRDAQTGKPDPQFQQIFVKNRQKTLPDWVERSRFNHFFRLAINTRLSPTEAGKIIKQGDLVLKPA